MGLELHQGGCGSARLSWGSNYTMGLEIHHGVRTASRGGGGVKEGVCVCVCVCDTILVGRCNSGGP